MKYWPPMPDMPVPPVDDLSTLSTEAHADEMIAEMGLHAIMRTESEMVIFRNGLIRHLDAAEQRGYDLARDSS